MRTTTSFFFLMSLTIVSSSHSAPKHEKKTLGDCGIKVFNIYKDENFKTPEEDTITKVAIFEPTNLAEDSAFMGVLLPKALVQDLKPQLLRAEIKLININSKKQPLVSAVLLNKIHTWSENSEFFVIEDFNPSEFLNPKKVARPQKIIITLKNNLVEQCSSTILVDPLDPI